MRSAFRGLRLTFRVLRYVVAFCVLRYVFAFCGLRFPFLRVFAFLFREQRASFSEETGFFQKLDFAEIRDHRLTEMRSTNSRLAGPDLGWKSLWVS